MAVILLVVRIAITIVRPTLFDLLLHRGRQCKGDTFGGCYEVATLMPPKTVTMWVRTLLHHVECSRQQSVGNRETFIGVGYGRGVDFSTIYLRYSRSMPVVVVLTQHTATKTLILQRTSPYSDKASFTFDGLVWNTCHMFCKENTIK